MSTIYGLGVGFEGHLVGRDLLDELAARNVRMIRHDCLGVGSVGDLASIIAETVGAELAPLLVLRPEQLGWLSGAYGVLDVSVRNEPNLGTPPTPRMTPDEYAADVRIAHTYLTGPHRLWAGVISNLDVDALNWLKASLEAGWPEGVGVDIHWYPPKGQMPPNNQHKGFGSREHEVERLKSVIGDRPWGVSELGYNDGEGLTDQQVLDATRWERDFWQEQGAAFCVFYQVNSGPSSHYLDHFGWRDTAGNWKPVSEALRT